MERWKSWDGAILILLGLLGLSAGTWLRESSGASLPAPPGLPSSAVAVPAGPQRSQVDWLVNTRETVALLADHLGVPRGEIRGSADPDRTTAGEALDKLEREPARLEELEASLAESCERASLEPRPDAGESQVAAACLLARARQHARAAGIEIRFVITTQPDYVDSKSDWLFDLHLDALERAASAGRYVSDRFVLPDADLAGRPDAVKPAQVLRHEREPAALLFRGRPKPPEPGKPAEPPRRLVLLVVPENATSGVEREPLLSAIALVSAWSPDRPVLLLGPCFSGSRDSLRLALEDAFRSGLAAPFPTEASAGPRVRIVSGNATSPDNKTTLDLCVGVDGRALATCPTDAQTPPARRFSEFFATTATDPDHERVLSAYLESVNPEWKNGHHVARLVESNTGWSGTFLDRVGECEKSSKALACAWTFTFPLHISRLSAQASAAVMQKPGQDRDEKPPAEGGPTKDVPPAMTPGTTLQMVEAALEQVLTGIRRLDISAVGIYATDKRDHLFLAQEIRRRAPDVQLFSLEGNLIYLLRDFRPYLRGTVVAGSYPLFSLTQPTFDAGGPPRQQFPTMGAQGMYNALLALLEEPDSMLDYDCPDGRPGSGPCVWLGLVGRNGFWPIRREQPPPSGGYYWTPRRWPSVPAEPSARAWTSAAPRPAPRIAASEARFPRTVKILLVVVLLAAVPLARAALSTLARLLPRQRWLPARIQNRRLDAIATRLWAFPRVPRGAADDPTYRLEYRLSLVARWGGVLAAGAWLAALVAVPADWPLLVPILEWARAAALLVLGVAALFTLADGWRSMRPHREATLQRSPAVLVGVWALWEMSGALDALGLRGDGLGPVTALRVASVGTFVSPLVPVVLFSAALYVWGTWNLRRIHQQSIRFNPDSPVMALLGGDDREAGALMTEELNSPTLRMDRLGFVMLLLCALAVAWLAWPLRHTPDGASMGMTLLLGTLLLVLIAGHTLGYCWRLGRLLLRCLRGLNLHPIGRAFSLIAREPFVWRLSLDEPRSTSLAPLVRQSRALALAIAERGAETPGLPVREPEASPPRRERRKSWTGEDRIEGTPDARGRALGRTLKVRWSDVPPLLAAKHLDLHDAELPVAPRLPFQATPVWLHAEALTGGLERMLERGPWMRHPLRSAPRKEASRAHQEGEMLIALQLALVVQHLVGRLAAGLSVAMVVVLLLLGSHLFYSFMGRQTWLWIDWVAVAFSAVVALTLMVRLERDPVTSRLWSTHPGRIDWSGGLIRQIVLYGAIPVLTLFATLFPEVGSSALSWLEPVRKALP